jgi:arsenate reductase
MASIDFIFKAMGDPVRIQILQMLAENGEMCVCRITENLDMTQSSVSHHLAALKNADLVSVRRGGQWSYYSLRGDTLTDNVIAFVQEMLDKLAISSVDGEQSRKCDPLCCNGENPVSMKKVVFVCIHNSGRSQMAEAFANRLGAGVVYAESAGTAPGLELNPVVVKAMEEIGYDMSGHHPKMLTAQMIEDADRVITMGCGVEPDGAVCPVVFTQSEDWGLDDPNGKLIEEVRVIRDDIMARVQQLISEMKGA